tara:strand:+ start:703 stop:1848 length:1146 start_codon:yes stop_codon:yes gene_type:complete
MDMASRLREEGNAVRILVGGTPDMEVPRRYLERELDVTCLPDLGRKINPIRDIKASIALRRAAKEFSPDLISLHSSKAGAVGRISLIGLKIPIIYTPHCWSFVDGFPNARVYQVLEKVLAPFSSRIVAVCEDEREFGLARGVSTKDKLLTIHNGVTDRFSGVELPSREIGKPVRIIMVGRFEEQKNQALLIQALAKLDHLPWNLTLIGEGPLMRQSIDLANELKVKDKIHFAGYSSRVQEELANHDLFALITNWEGFPRSILEAMSTGLPVIASDVGGNAEAVIDGRTGRIVSPGDSEQLVEALTTLISDPEQLARMGREGRQRFVEKFSFDTMFEKYSQLYASLTTKHSLPESTAPATVNILPAISENEEVKSRELVSRG